MKVSRTVLSIVALGSLFFTAGSIWGYRDYHKWLALGPGGLPYNLRGWATTTWMRTLKGDPLDADCFAVGALGDHAYLSQVTAREGSRPTIAVYPIPHRQLDQLPNPEMKQQIIQAFDTFVGHHANLVHYQLSFFEKRNQSIFLSQPEVGNDFAKESHGEIAHVHPSDGSMHMIFSPSDARMVISAGWGESHPLAGKMGLPDTYLLVYPPRNEQELGITKQLLAASVAHMSTH